MPKPSVTVVRCRACRRVECITSENDRFWCAWCQNWVAVDTVAVPNAVLIAEGDQFRLAPAPISTEQLLPLRLPFGWLVQWNTLYETHSPYVNRNLFLATSEATQRVIDADSWNGVFRLRVLPLRDPFDPPRELGEPLETGWDAPIHTFEVDSILILIAELEACLRGERG